MAASTVEPLAAAPTALPRKPQPAALRPRLRPATVLDAPAISRLASATFAASFGYSLPPADLVAYLATSLAPAAFERDIANPLVDIVVAVAVAAGGGGVGASGEAAADQDEQHVVGYVQLTRGTREECVEELLAGPESGLGGGGTVELQRLYVSPECQGMGVGKALVGRVEEMARAMGFASVWLGVWEENANAKRAYERFGFAKVGEHDFAMGDTVQRDWVMWKRL